MDKLREEALEKDWYRKIKLAMLASKQGERPFHEWAYRMQPRNALLRGRPHHFSDEVLCETLQNNMDQGLELRVRRIEAVKMKDECVAREREVLREVAREE